MLKKRVFVLMVGGLLLAWCGAAVAAQVDYLGYQNWGGTWSDAEKQWSRWSECSLHCWAATASNNIQYTGWTPNTSLDDADEIFRYYQDKWTNVGGWVEYGWNWWLSGINPGQGQPGLAQVDVTPSGGFYSQYTASNFWEMKNYQQTQEDLMAMVERTLKAGDGVGLWVYGPSSHAISCWGIKIDDSYAVGDKRRYLGLYITDSDDNYMQEPAPDVMYYTPVGDNGTIVTWDLTEYRGGGYDLYGVQALERPVTHFNGGTAAWGTASNWDNALPDTFLATYVDAGTAQINGNVNVGKVYVGFAGTGVVTQAQNTFTATELHLGNKAGADGRYDIGGGTLNVSKIFVGEAGTGRFNVTNSGATINISKSLEFGATTANYSAVADTTLRFANDTAFKNAAKITANVAGLAETTFLFNGTGNSSINFFEVAGQDLGAIVDGFTNNFHIKGITIGGSGAATLKLVNDYINYNGTPPGTYSEALYVHNLIINSGSTLNLNGFHLYCGTFTNYGSVIGGSVIVVQGGAGGLGDNPVIPEPTALLMILPALLGLGTLIRRRR